MVIIHMVEGRKMRNILYKSILVFSLSLFVFLGFSSVSFADNYGEGNYGSYGYSASSPSTSSTTGTTQAFRDKFLLQQQALAIQQVTTEPTTVVDNTTNTTTKPTTLNLTRTLKLKMTGNDVKDLQTYLNTHGYTLSTTGAGSSGKETTYFGSLTKKAVIKFQTANNLVPDGIVGPKTKSKLIQ